MAKSWIGQRFRSALLSENLSLIVLGILRESHRSEWEILNAIYHRYESTPGSKEFRKLTKSLISKGYATVESVEGVDKLRISQAGIDLLRRLEMEYRAIVSNVETYPSDSSDFPQT